MANTVISFPIPLYANVPIHAEFYLPNVFLITGITLGITTTITTSVNTNFVVGQNVRLIIPPTFGSRQLNEKTGYVINIPSANQVELSIDTSENVDAFILSSATTKAQIIPIGDINSGAINSFGRVNNMTFIPGSFINISPL